MGLKDWISGIINIPDEEEYTEGAQATADEPETRKREVEEPVAKKVEAAPRIIKSKNSGIQQPQSQMKMIIYRPERFDEVTAIADDLNAKRAVVLNLEVATRDVSRRIIDFLSGVAYALDGQIKKVANSTFIITPYNVDIMGDLIDELSSTGVLF